MTRLWLIFAFLLFTSHPATAQLISPEPLCVQLVNTTNGEVLGHVETTEYHDPEGNLSWHRSNFRLEANGEQEVCSTGPFFEGYRLRVVVKTIMPLYSCLTEMNRVIHIERRMSDIGINELVMDCPSERRE